MRARGNERGIALVVVLWVGLLVAAIAGAFILDTRTSTRLTRNFLDNAQARALADGGVHIAIFELTRSDRERGWERDGRIYQRTVPGGTLHIAIENEAGKIDINNADDDILEGLFRSVGLADEEARSLVDSMERVRRGGGVREELFRAAGVPSDRINSLVNNARSAGNGNSNRRRVGSRIFQSVDSLGQVPGMTASLYARLRPALTIYGEADMHYLSAPREALLAIPDMPREAVDVFLKARAGADPTLPLNEFLLRGRARDFWREHPSQFVTVKVMARSGNGARFTRIAIVEIRPSSDPVYAVREWREGDATTLRPPVPTEANASPLPRGAS